MGQFQVLCDLADAGPAGTVGVAAVLEVHIDCLYQPCHRLLLPVEQQHILKGDVAVGSRHLPDTLATHRLTARQSVGFFRLYPSSYTSFLQVSAPSESPANTGQAGIFTRNSAKTYSPPHDQRQFQSAENLRGSPHCGLP